MRFSRESIIVASLILALATFGIGYWFYVQSAQQVPFLQIAGLVPAFISDASHSAAGPVGPNATVAFRVRGAPNGTAHVTLSPGGVVTLAEGARGDYSGSTQLSAGQSMNISVVYELVTTTRATREGLPIVVDADPPRIFSAEAAPQSLSEGDVLSVAVRAEPGNVTVKLATLTDFLPAVPVNDTFEVLYLVRRGDNRNGIEAVIRAVDDLGNAAESRRFLPVRITTSGPTITSLSWAPTTPLADGKIVVFTFDGEAAGDAFVILDTARVDMDELAPGRYTGSYTVRESNTTRNASITAFVTKNLRTSSRLFGFIDIDTQPPNITGLTIQPALARKGEVVTVSLSTEPRSRVFFRVDGLTNDTEMREDSPGSFKGSFTVDVEEAAGVRVSAVATDVAGNTGPRTAAPQALSVDSTPPAVASFDLLTQQPVGRNVPLVFKAFAEANATLEVKLSNWTITLVEISAGEFNGSLVFTQSNVTFSEPAVLTATDEAGNVALRTTPPITVDTIPPVITRVEHNGTRVLQPGEAVLVTLRGEPGGKAWFELRSQLTNRSGGKTFLYESEREAGVYRGVYAIRPDDVLEQGVIVGFLQDQAGNTHEFTAAQAGGVPFQLTTLLGVTFLILIIPTFAYYYREHRTAQDYEEAFPDFLSDLHSVMGSQLPLPSALKIIRHSEYGKLGQLVARMHNRIELGMPFPMAFKKFGDEARSRSIKSAVAVLVNAYKAGGGRLGQIFAATATSFRRIRNLKKERDAELGIHVVSGYIIFVIFIGIIVVLNNSLFVAAAQLQAKAAAAGAAEAVVRSKFSDLFFYLFFIQALFGGISIGELTEGSFMAGLKHAVVMMVVALLAAALLA
jgi:hypothetical protein